MEMVECSLAASRAARPVLGRVPRSPAPFLGAGRARLRVRSERREQPPPVVRASAPPERDGGALGKAAAGLAAAAVVSLSGFAGDFTPPPARAESLTVAFPVSKAREVGLRGPTAGTTFQERGGFGLNFSFGFFLAGEPGAEDAGGGMGADP